MHLRPDLVHMSSAPWSATPIPARAYLTTDLLGGSAVRTYHDFGDLSPSGTLGDPSLASAEKGARFFAAVADALARFIEDFATWPIPEGEHMIEALRVGVIGLGCFGETPRPRLSPHCRTRELVAVCDRDREPRRRNCQPHRRRVAYADFRDAARAARPRRGQHLPARPRA